MKTSSAKQKGRLLQQWVRDKLIEYGEGLDLSDVRSTSMGAGGEDIQLSTAARKQYPISIECKSKAAVAVYTFIDQAKENAPEGAQPLAVVKANRRDPLVVVDADYFFKLMRSK